MKKEVRKLREKAINALILSIDHFNRPFDLGRTEAVLIMLDHSFEMILKATILHKGGKIRKLRHKQTIGFEACIERGLASISGFLTKEQATTLRVINGLRNAAQHYLVDTSEHQLYIYAQASVTLFRDIHDGTFGQKLLLDLPERVLPISTTAPKNLSVLFDSEVKEINDLLIPGRRKRMDAILKMRSLALLENAVNGVYEQPSDKELEKIFQRLGTGETWISIFPGIASIKISTEGDEPNLCLRITKNEGIPVRISREKADAVLAVKRVNELDFYSLGAAKLAEKVGLTQPKCRAVVDHLDLRNNKKFFKEIKIGKAKYPRYSQKTIDEIKSALKTESIDDIWVAYRTKRKG